MKIKKGTMLNVNHCRKGKFIGFATEDFETTKEEFYPICVDNKTVEGLAKDWEAGERVPCRASLCTIEIVGEG